MKSRGLKSIVARRNAVGQGCKMFLPTLCDTFTAELLQAMEEGERIEVAEGFSTFLKCVLLAAMGSALVTKRCSNTSRLTTVDRIVVSVTAESK